MFDEAMPSQSMLPLAPSIVDTARRELLEPAHPTPDRRDTLAPTASSAPCSPCRTPVAVTYGVELEFLVPELSTYAPDPFPEDPRWLLPVDVDETPPGPVLEAKVTELLNAADVPCRLADDPESGHDYESGPAPAATLAGVAPGYACWTTNPEPSVYVDMDDPASSPYLFSSVELASRVFDSLPALSRDVRAATAVVARNVRAAVNHTAGTHIHVGLRRRHAVTGRPLRHLLLDDARRAVAMYLIVEPALYELVAPWRRAGPKSAWCAPLAAEALLATAPLGTLPGDAPPPSRLDAPRRPAWAMRLPLRLVQRLIAATSMPALAALLLRNGHEAPGGRRLGLALRPELGTLEFRQLEGSLDAQLVERWAEVVGAVARAGADWDHSVLDGLRVASARVRLGHLDETGQALAMLDVLGVDAKGRSFWEEKMRNMERPEADRGVCIAGSRVEFVAPPELNPSLSTLVSAASGVESSSRVERWLETL